MLPQTKATQSSMPMGELKVVWHKRCNPLQLRAGDKPPLWADLGLRPVVGATLDIKLGPRPLEHRDVALLLSCWKRWDFTSVADSAINTWLKGANPAFGPDCEDSPCYRIRNMSVLEVMRLFGECGFEFLPKTDPQRRPGLEVVMTVGLHLCALEMTDQQLYTLACIALAGQLPEFFPLQQWICAVKKSFLSQEVFFFFFKSLAASDL